MPGHSTAQATLKYTAFSQIFEPAPQLDHDMPLDKQRYVVARYLHGNSSRRPG
jgi:hypothetical protein